MERLLYKKKNQIDKIISKQPILKSRQEIVLLCPEGHKWRLILDYLRRKDANGSQ